MIKIKEGVTEAKQRIKKEAKCSKKIHDVGPLLGKMMKTIDPAFRNLPVYDLNTLKKYKMGKK